METVRANILMVDDRPENLIALEAVLKPLNQNLVMASSGEEALKALLHQDFAVILLDVQMPGLDGFDTAEQIKRREKTRDIPIIFLTAISREPHHQLRGYSAGAVDYLAKPFDPWVLRAKVGVFIDLYQKNALLKSQAVELRRSNAELEQFAYVASHDLQEPLGAVTGYLQILGEMVKGKLGDDAEMLIRRAQSVTDGMAALIRDLLDYSRVGTRGAPFKPADTQKIVESAVINLYLSIERSGAKVNYQELPTVMGDGGQLIRLFQNLIGNGIKFASTKKPEVTVTAERDDDWWRFGVSDNGIGIDPTHFDRIFTLFERLNPSEKFTGSGIGLSVCKRIVERHGGHIWVESKLGAGSTFYFTLPTVDAKIQTETSTSVTA